MTHKGSKDDPIELSDNDFTDRARVAIPETEEGDIAPIHSSLESVERRVAERYEQQARKAAEMRDKHAAEKVHSRFLRQTMGTSADSKYAGDFWTQRNRANVPLPGLGRVQASTSSLPGSRSERNPGRNSRGRSLPTVRSSQNLPTVNVHERCQVINCEIEFSTLDGYRNHMEDHIHSPCWPIKHLLDGVCRVEPKQYCCPICGLVFESVRRCEDHMRVSGHITLQEPLVVGGYMCSSCLVVFPSTVACMLHKHKHDHFTPVELSSEASQQPQDGATVLVSEGKEPVVLPEPMLARFVARCRRVKSSVECIDCGFPMDTCEDCSSHIQKEHDVMCFTTSSLVEVLKQFLCKYTCVQCLRLYPNLPAAGFDAIHQCCDTAQGMIVEYQYETFQEFVLRSSMSHIPLENACSSVSASSSQSSQLESTAMSSATPNTASAVGQINCIDASPPGELSRDKVERKSKSTASISISSIKRSIDSDEEGDFDIQQVETVRTPRKKMKTKHHRKGYQPKDSQLSTVQQKIGAMNIKGFSHLTDPVVPSSVNLDPETDSETEGDRGRSRGCGGAGASWTRENKPASSGAHHGTGAAPSCSTREPSTSATYALHKDGSGTSGRTMSPPARRTRFSDGTPSDLDQMHHIVFVDLDNWSCVFKRLPMPLPAKTFVWGFSGGNANWKEPKNCRAYDVTKDSNCFCLQFCGNTKNAADFAICLQVGRMDERLPNRIPFTILSGDGGFNELETIMKNSTRLFKVTNPHHTSLSEVYALIISMGDT